MAVADLRRNGYSVRYAQLARPRHPGPSLLGKCWGKPTRKRHVERMGDRFRVRAEPLPGNADECGVWSVCRFADVCHCAGWSADSKHVAV